MKDSERNKSGIANEPVEPNMHGVWLVADPNAFVLNPGHASERDHPLTLGLSHKEWFALYFDVLKIDQGGYRKWADQNPLQAQNSIVAEFSEEISEYPMLSRIRGYLFDAVFESDEVEQLRQECLRVRELTSNEVALGALDKLLSICDSADREGLNIYFLAD
ncbi:MAG: hypothetical protein ACREBG_25400 [Pyrinomonadaceae bacterium]